MKIRKSTPLLACLIALNAIHAQPTNNPVTQFYPGLGQYDWTDQLAWGTVYDVTTDTKLSPNPVIPDDGFLGLDGLVSFGDDLAEVQAKIAALSAAGGGVLYFPAGSYHFSDDLLVHNGVVIRGVQPGDGYVADNLDPARDVANPVDEVDNAKSSLFELQTKFEFPKFIFDKTANGGAGHERRNAFKAIRLNDPYNDSNVGICWIDINRARIEWMDYGETVDGMSSSYWAYFGVPWDPSLPFADPSNKWLQIKGMNWVIFGNRINNAARWDNRSGVSPPTGAQPAWSIWPKRISGQIDTFNYGNQIVANNRLMDKHYSDWDNSQPNGLQPGSGIDDFLIEDYVDRNGNIVGDDWFSYTRGYGIKMNRSVGLDGNDRDYSPTRYPLLYRTGITCRDNWLFVTRRVGIYIGGTGAQCIGNFRTDRSWTLDGDYRKQAVIDPTGRDYDSNNGRTQENRGIDMTGFNTITHKNYMLVFRTKSPGGPYFSTCGEGFLHQEVGGGTPVYDWVITDNYFSGYIGIYKSKDIRGLLVQGNDVPGGLPDLTETAALYIQSDTNDTNYNMQDVLIDSNTAVLNSPKETGRFIASAGLQNVVVSNNDFGGGIVNATDGVQFSGNSSIGTLNSSPPDSAFDALPVVQLASPVPPLTVAPGAVVSMVIDASDDGASPVAVEIFSETINLGAAALATAPNLYTYDLTVSSEPGTYYYMLKASGTPDAAYSDPVVIVVEEGGSTPGAPVLYINMQTGSQLVLSFDSENGALYRLMQDDDLGSWTLYEDNITGDGNTIERLVPVPADRVFYLLEVIE
jgi:hypothetical protein